MNQQIELFPILSGPEAAQFLKLSESTLAKLRHFGGGRQYCTLGRRIVYRRADLERWLNDRLRRSTSGR